ncbi:hypothetical protein [Croceibacterium ferulae]|uniref:hypothetical protein n=1 Tax=Croceibacterium ferulae TaxID=1854641 RepID=UPI001F4D8DF0|nr:hypothetical protein [Croceibacterium ferulae]
MDQLLRQVRVAGDVMVNANSAFAPSGATSNQFKRAVAVMMKSSNKRRPSALQGMTRRRFRV